MTADLKPYRKPKNKIQQSSSEIMNYGKMPPNVSDYETAVLGAIMLEKHAFEAVSDILKPECFYQNANQKIFQAMCNLSKSSKPIDLLTVVGELRAKDELDSVGGPYAITKLTTEVVSAANIEFHARAVLETFMLREMIRISGQTISAAYENGADIFDLMDEHDKELTNLSTGSLVKSYSDIPTELVKRIQRIEKLRANPEHITGVPSMYRDLDFVTHGWQPTDLIILAARPSVGKTAFALNLARNAALHPTKPTPVAFFSMEMSTGQLMDRIISAESGLLLENLNSGRVTEDEISMFYNKSFQKLSNAPIFFDDTPAMGIFEMRAKCRRMKSKLGLGLIIIDYLQLMSGTGDKRSSNREQEISTISRNLKALAKELGIPIIALSQLSREVEKRKDDDKKPRLSDLRESGAIEQDADMVMFLYRPEYYNITADEMGESNKGETIIKIAKHRNGTLEEIKLRALLHIQKFTDWEEVHGYKHVHKDDFIGWKPAIDDNFDNYFFK